MGKFGSAAERPGFWGFEEARKAWRDVGGAEGSDIVKVLKNSKRESLSASRVRKIVQDEEGGTSDGNRLRTQYIFSTLLMPEANDTYQADSFWLVAGSEDGYPFTGYGRRGSPTWIPEPGKHDPGAFCEMRFEDCFASVRDGEPVTIDGAFKRVAFDRTSQCGDCSKPYSCQFQPDLTTHAIVSIPASHYGPYCSEWTPWTISGASTDREKVQSQLHPRNDSEN